jgi:hypothetical protein
MIMMLKPSEIKTYQQAYQAHLKQLDQIRTDPRKQMSRRREPPSSSSMLSRSASQPSQHQEPPIRDLPVLREQFHLPLIYQEILKRNQRSHLCRRETSRQEEHDHNMKMYSRIYSKKSDLSAKALGRGSRVPLRHRQKALASLLRREAEVLVFTSKLLPLPGHYFEISISLESMQVIWPSIEGLGLRMAVLFLGENHSNPARARIKHTRKVILGSQIMNEFTNSTKLTRSDPSKTVLQSQIVTVQELETAVFEFRGGNARTTDLSNVFFMVVGVEGDREQDLFFFGLKDGRDEQVQVLNNRGKAVGTVSYDFRFRTILRRSKPSAQHLSGITEEDSGS